MMYSSFFAGAPMLACLHIAMMLLTWIAFVALLFWFYKYANKKTTLKLFLSVFLLGVLGSFISAYFMASSMMSDVGENGKTEGVYGHMGFGSGDDEMEEMWKEMEEHFNAEETSSSEDENLKNTNYE